jgi:hypothetical protein
MDAPPPRVNLEGRRVLLISPHFFGYERRIANRLKARGAEVAFIDDRPSNSTLSKLLIRVGAAVIQPKLEAYHQAQMRKLAGRVFDELLFIVPEACSARTFQRYREAFPGARRILYMWDSFENKVRLRRCLPLFDQAFSFDDEDCQTYGMSFRPLFFGEAAYAVSETDPEPYAFSFIGTIHSDRYRIIKALVARARQMGLRTFVYPYLPSRLIYGLYRCTKREFWGVSRADFHFKPLPYPEVVRVLRHSSAVVDIEHPGQRGLTMRTLEVIGAGKKLVTTNERIRNYPFYSPDRIQIIDRRTPVLSEAFFCSPPPPLQPTLIAQYSLDGWIDDLFGSPRSIPTD